VTRGSPIPIVALDVPTMSDARRVVDSLGPAADFYKVGLQLYTREGPPVVEWLHHAGKRVFLDLKLHDIPNTVRGATASAASLGVELLTVHAVGGEAMIRAAVDGAGVTTGILAVTVLTSMSAADYAAALGVGAVSIEREVLRFAAVAATAGARGVVCSGSEVAQVVAQQGDGFGALVPGIRFAGGGSHDQSRVVTPAEARRLGATWVIVGRAVTADPDPRAAYARMVAELAG
jgi:orotidine-5'-phosphate decarboxylase